MQNADNPHDAARPGSVPASREQERPGRSRLFELGRRFSAGLQDFYAAPYRRSFQRAKRDQDDLFMMLVLSEALGLPNPASYYTLELLPVVYENFHEWHTRMGMERSPLNEISCC
ncbi:cory-CC-star protein [Kocuria atrinae]|uniref:cory-CC-star protein n=1 Tax=Kocuria atrinae TaxID=592377 RepID=UPI000319BFA6|nr:cory-CC-star protein [Kocuria atrinae]